MSARPHRAAPQAREADRHCEPCVISSLNPLVGAGQPGVRVVMSVTPGRSPTTRDNPAWRKKPAGQHIELGRSRSTNTGRPARRARARPGPLGAIRSLPVGLLSDPFVERALDHWSVGIDVGRQSSGSARPPGSACTQYGVAAPVSIHRRPVWRSHARPDTRLLSYEPAFAIGQPMGPSGSLAARAGPPGGRLPAPVHPSVYRTASPPCPNRRPGRHGRPPPSHVWRCLPAWRRARSAGLHSVRHGLPRVPAALAGRRNAAPCGFGGRYGRLRPQPGAAVQGRPVARGLGYAPGWVMPRGSRRRTAPRPVTLLSRAWPELSPMSKGRPAGGCEANRPERSHSQTICCCTFEGQIRIGGAAAAPALLSRRM